MARTATRQVPTVRPAVTVHPSSRLEGNPSLPECPVLFELRSRDWKFCADRSPTEVLSLTSGYGAVLVSNKIVVITTVNSDFTVLINSLNSSAR